MTDEEKKDIQEDAPKEESKDEPKEEKTSEEKSEEIKEDAPEETSETETEETKDEAPKSTEPAFKAKLIGFDDIRPGQTVRLHERIKDISPKGEERERIQMFEGIILGMKGSGISRTITIKKISKGNYAVEKIFPINSPVVSKIELVKTAKVRRAKLNYLKNPKRRFKRKLRETHEKK
jgi:large subunit ribosomal protein L19